MRPDDFGEVVHLAFSHGRVEEKFVKVVMMDHEAASENESQPSHKTYQTNNTIDDAN